MFSLQKRHFELLITYHMTNHVREQVKDRSAQTPGVVLAVALRDSLRVGVLI